MSSAIAASPVWDLQDRLKKLKVIRLTQCQYKSITLCATYRGMELATFSLDWKLATGLPYTYSNMPCCILHL